MGVLILMNIVVSAVGQETDDMYFNKKDREKLKSARSNQSTVNTNDQIDRDYKAFKKKHFNEEESSATEEEAGTNPTDSYSSRNVNPEYVARTHSQQASEDEQNYFVEGYKPKDSARLAANTNAAWNNPYASSYYGVNPYYNNYGSMYGYNDPWRSSFGYYPYSNFYSPYSSFYSPYGYSPYYAGSGWSFSLGYMWGNAGWGNSWYNPYSWYSPYGYYGYPGTVVVVDRGHRTYGKYPSRGGNAGSFNPNARTSTASTNTGRTRTSVVTRNSASRQQDEYYNSRRSAALDYQRRYVDNSNAGNSNSFFRGGNTNSSNNSRSSFFNNNSGGGRPSSYTPSRSSGGGFSPSHSGGGGGGTGRSRGH